MPTKGKMILESTETVERRRHPRAEIKLAANVSFPLSKKPEVEGTVLNLSEGGAFIEVFKHPEVGEIIELHVHLDKDSSPLSIQARVIYQSHRRVGDIDAINSVDGMNSWIRGDREGVGVQFLNISDKDKVLIKNLVLAVI